MRILLICFLFISQISLGQDGFGKIKGRLNYGNEPAKHFLIELTNLEGETFNKIYTNIDGTFYLDSIAPDFYYTWATPPDSLEMYSSIRPYVFIEEFRVISNLTHFIDVTLNDYKREREYIKNVAKGPPTAPDLNIDKNGRFNGTIKREDIIQRP